jgi:hypothetical protein
MKHENVRLRRRRNGTENMKHEAQEKKKWYRKHET